MYVFLTETNTIVQLKIKQIEQLQNYSIVYYYYYYFFWSVFHNNA